HCNSTRDPLGQIATNALSADHLVKVSEFTQSSASHRCANSLMGSLRYVVLRGDGGVECEPELLAKNAARNGARHRAVGLAIEMIGSKQEEGRFVQQTFTGVAED